VSRKRGPEKSKGTRRNRVVPLKGKKGREPRKGKEEGSQKKRGKGLGRVLHGVFRQNKKKRVPLGSTRWTQKSTMTILGERGEKRKRRRREVKQEKMWRGHPFFLPKREGSLGLSWWGQQMKNDAALCNASRTRKTIKKEGPPARGEAYLSYPEYHNTHNGSFPG